jgi:UDP-N-acetylglucosamine 2-epimerase (non-hydrolysing)
MKNPILCVMGTRPEVIKMAPVIHRLRDGNEKFDVRVLATGQHRSLLDQALADFDLVADQDLALMLPNQDLAGLTARALTGLSEVYMDVCPSLVLAQGDTTTVLCAALACYYARVPFGHVEAGLRTGQPYFPFPEEKNRVLAGHLADLHFAPTISARDNLLREGIDPKTIHVTGNTVIDALLATAREDYTMQACPKTDRYILLTAHRRENFGAPLEEICLALLDLVKLHSDMSVVYPVHPNPNVRQVVQGLLGAHERIALIEPVGYPEFVALMKGAHLILTDSGGVQEEAPSLGKPVLVLRDETERPEAVAAGTVQLVGPHRDAIRLAVTELWENPEIHNRFAEAVNPYGDGWAAERIARVIAARYGIDPGPLPDAMNPVWPIPT